MKFGIVTFPGSNCDYDAFRAVVDSLGEQAVYLWHKDHDLQGVDVVILPGGFSYGDYLRAGAIARFIHVMEEVSSHSKRFGTVIGICNGCKIACEAGLLPGALLRNANLQFISAPVRLRVENVKTSFTSAYNPGQILTIPIAHGEGRFTADTATLDELESSERVLFRYVDSRGMPTAEGNPNGSERNIAGIVNREGNVLGMMPLPERAVDALLGSDDGLCFFESILSTVAA
jgi:phosphoribosylformylglycinamidine synthase I